MDSSGLTQPEFWKSIAPVVLAPPHLESEGDRLGAYLEQQDWAQGAVVFATSGSTGKPKWVVHTRASLLASAVMVNRHLQVGGDDCWFLTLPVFHVGGFGVITRAYEAGCRFAHFDEKWDAMSFVGALKKEEATLISLVPTQLHDLVESLISPPKSLRAVVVGGGALAESLGRRARELGWPVLQSYGMTEAGSQIATEDLSCLEREFEVDALPVLEGWEVQANASQVLEIRGEALAQGYVREESEGFDWVPFYGKEWYATNDIVSVFDNRVSFLRRSDREIKVRGELVNVGELERSLQGKLGALGKCVLVPRFDERVGYRLFPVCVFSESEERQGDAVLEEFNADLPRYCQLEKPFKLAELPLTELGKVDFLALAELLRD